MGYGALIFGVECRCSVVALRVSFGCRLLLHLYSYIWIW